MTIGADVLDQGMGRALSNADKVGVLPICTLISDRLRTIDVFASPLALPVVMPIKFSFKSSSIDGLSDLSDTVNSTPCYLT